MTRKPKASTFISCDPAKVFKTIAVGDSITQGQNQLLGGYRLPLYTLDPGLNFVGRNFSYGYHEGYSGFRTDEIDATVTPIIPVFNPAVLLVMAGSNNIAQGQSAAVAFANLNALVTNLQSASGSVIHVLVFTIPVTTIPATQNAYNALILGASWPAGITSHDVTSTLVYPTDFSDVSHPNTVGYQKIANLANPAVRTVVF